MGPELDTEPGEFLEEACIETSEELEGFIDRVRNDEVAFSWVAVDTEADSMHSYETKLCLLQFASARRLAIIDPLSIPIEGMQPLIDLLEEADVVWMHGADYDMAMFRQTFDLIPGTVWDTQTAARLTGVTQFGLANLIESEFGVKLSKQSQKADWGRRPLPEKMRRYALNDVRYILPMAKRLVSRLEESGRKDWFEESCAAAREGVVTREDKPTGDQWRITGWGNLDCRGLAFLRALWHWRDDECRELDRPAFKLISNQEILSAAERLQRGERVDPPGFLRPQFARRMIKTISDSRNIPESDWPKKFRRTDGVRLQIDESHFNRLREHRNRAAKDLGIDPTLIAPRSVLERLAATNLDKEENSSLLLGWQLNLLNSAIPG